MNASSTPAASASGPRPLTDAVTEIQKMEASRMTSSGRSSQVSSRSGAEGSR